MRADRIVNRWNLKSRARAGRYLLNWEDRLRQGALNYYREGYAAGQAQMSPPPPVETAHSNGTEQSTVDRPTSGGSLLIPGEHL